jgi:hypothetical protein
VKRVETRSRLTRSTYLSIMLAGQNRVGASLSLVPTWVAKKATFSHIWPHLATYFLFFCGFFARYPGVYCAQLRYAVVKVRAVLNRASFRSFDPILL